MMVPPNLPSQLKNIKLISSTLSKGLSVASNNRIVSKIANPVVGGGEQKFHVSVKQDYPQAELKIPFNIDQSESTRFSPQRSRDITSDIIDSHNQSCNYNNTIDITIDNTSSILDPHVEAYDSNGSISLNSSMQSNVPHPFGGMNKFTHLNMPGGQWGQGIRLISNDMHSSHYTNLRRSVRMNWSSYDQNIRVNNIQNDTMDKGICLLHGLNDDLLIVNKISKNLLPTKNIRACFANLSSVVATTTTTIIPTTSFSNDNARRMYSSSSNAPSSSSSPSSDTKKTQNDQDKKENDAQESTTKTLTRQEILKKAIKEYGSTVIVFHVGISLISLGSFYLLVSSGLDIVSIIEYFGWSNSALSNKLTTGASTFVIAYAVHKVFAPVRISITLGATPFIVKYLRNKGFLKKTISNKQ